MRPLVSDLGEYISDERIAALTHRFYLAVGFHKRAEGTLPEALCGIIGGLWIKPYTPKVEHVVAHALRLLCSFSPPLIGESLRDTLQQVLDGLCINCGCAAAAPASSDAAGVPVASDPTCVGTELFLCAACAATQLVPLAAACAELRDVPSTALPDLVIPPGRGGQRFTLRMYVDTVAATEASVAAGKSVRAPDCFPKSLEPLLPVPGESPSDPVFVTLPGIEDTGVRRHLYEMRELCGEEVRGLIQQLTAPPRPAELPPPPRRPTIPTTAGPRSRPIPALAGCRVGGVDAQMAAKRESLRRMATRWGTVRNILPTVSPVAAAIWKCRDVLPGPQVLIDAAADWRRFFTLTPPPKKKAGGGGVTDVPDDVLPPHIGEAVRQLRAITDIISRASQGTEAPQAVCAQALRDRSYLALPPSQTKPRHKKPKKRAGESEDDDTS